MELKKAVAYLRVSTEEQTVENQRLAIQGYAVSNNYSVLTYFEDPATSGTIIAAKRNGFSEMLEFLRHNYVDAVIIYELSRVGRTFYDTLDAIKYVEQFAPIISCSPKELFLQTTEPGVRKLLIGILTWVAKREREVLVTRIKAGLARRKAEGKHCGQPFKNVDPKRLQQLLDSGMKIIDICAYFHITKPTLYRNIRMYRYQEKDVATS